jgi:hypothetical protein
MPKNLSPRLRLQRLAVRRSFAKPGASIFFPFNAALFRLYLEEVIHVAI